MGHNESYWVATNFGAPIKSVFNNCYRFFLTIFFFIKSVILIVWQAVETLLENLELDKRSYRLGLSQVGWIQKILLCVVVFNCSLFVLL